MSIFFPVSEFFQASGNAAAEFNEAVRDAIVGHACNLWAAYPDFMTNRTDPITSFARGFMNQACSPIQPPLPPPGPPYVGGQCCDANYTVTVNVTRSFNNGPPETFDQIFFVNQAKIVNSSVGNPVGNPNFLETQLLLENCAGVQFINSQPIGGVGFTGQINSTTIVRNDGLPDNCGDPLPGYGSPTPIQQDLNTVINITTIDTTDYSAPLIWNNTNNNFNFPMTFKYAGTNVTLDMSGLTIYGDLNIVSFNGGNDSPTPGSDGGTDIDGNPVDTTQPGRDYPTLPPPALVESVAATLEYLICNEGVIETVTETIKAIPGLPPAVSIILSILGQILTDICEAEGSEIGFPEVYPVLPGVERPAIVFYWKEFDMSGKALPSTYTSTVSNPSAAAIAAIPTVVVPDKDMGKYVVSVKLNDGSRIISSGVDEPAALAGYNFLLSQVDSALIPADEATVRSVTFRDILTDRTVKCTQIEYYPNGKQQNVSPAIVRRITP